MVGELARPHVIRAGPLGCASALGLLAGLNRERGTAPGKRGGDAVRRAVELGGNLWLALGMH